MKTEDEELYVLNTNSYKDKKKHFKKKGNKRNDKPKKDLSKVKCFKCEKFGHYRSNCPENSKQQVNYTNITKEDNYDPKNHVLYLTLSNEVSTKAWVINSGSSQHITGYKEALNFISKEVDGEVTIGDNSAHSVEGIGNCTLKLKSGSSLHFKRVLYVLGIKRNLILVTTLEDDGHNEHSWMVK